MTPTIPLYLARIRADVLLKLRGRLTQLVYDELRRIARRLMRNQPGHTLQPTALVHEAWAKLFHDAEPEFTDRAHFLAVMARVMRQVQIDHVRGAGADKRWGGQQRVPLAATVQFAEEGFAALKLIDVDRAVVALARENSGLAQIVEMHYFGGMTAWVVAKPRRLRCPIPYRHPPGAVIWVRLDHDIGRRILKEINTATQ